MKMLTAYTCEIDDVEVAVSEILSLLDLENNCLKNSMGIINCYSEFIESGVVSAVCDALPFDVIGCSSINCATNNIADMLSLTVSVLTSDDASFSCALTTSVSDDISVIRQTYAEALSASDDDTKMTLTYLPMILDVGAEIMLAEFDSVSPETPVFGTICCDHLDDYGSSVVIYNGEAYRTSVAMALISGNVNPKFSIASIPETKLQKQRAVITSVSGGFLREINNRRAADFFKELGIDLSDENTDVNAIPFIVDYKDGTPPVARAMYLANNEGISCGGNIPVGATLAVGSIDANAVVETATVAAETVAETAENCVLIFTCYARILTLGENPHREFEILAKTLGDLPYQVCYSLGEICPLYNASNDTINKFHNYTMISCTF